MRLLRLKDSDQIVLYTLHLEIDPTRENGWSSWQCPDCRTACASDNPCDCCSEGEYEEAEDLLA